MAIISLNFVTIGHVPCTHALRLIVTEIAFEEGSVRVDPFSFRDLSVFECSYEFLSGLVDDVSSLSVFLAIGPVARVDVFIGISHDTLSMSLSILPIAVIFTDLWVRLFTNTMLHVVDPGALVTFDVLGFGVGLCICVISLTVAFL